MPVSGAGPEIDFVKTYRESYQNGIEEVWYKVG